MGKKLDDLLYDFRDKSWETGYYAGALEYGRHLSGDDKVHVEDLRDKAIVERKIARFALVAYIKNIESDLFLVCQKLLDAERIADEFGIDDQKTILALIQASKMASAAISKAESHE